MEEEEVETEIYQILAAKKTDLDQNPVFTKIFRLPKNCPDWTLDLACAGMAYKNNIDPNIHFLHKAKWDPNQNIWVNVKFDKA
jgi:hypothetical protein